MDNTLSKLGQIRVFSKVLSKVSQIRNRGAKQKVLNALERNEYFQRFIHDPTKRQEFLTSASPYIKYRFYPKGTAIVELKKPLSSFSIIVKGKGLLYTQKDVDEMKKEGTNSQKSQVIQIYIRYMAREQLEDKFKKWLSNNEHGTKALRKRMASLSLTDEGIEKDSTIIDEDDFCSIVEQVLKEENPLLPPHLRENDLPFEEKLLLLSALGLPGDHLRNGNLALKREKELKAGDTFGEASLIKPIHANYVIIATEDTHIVSFTRTDYKLLFASDVHNIKEKIDFLQKTFVDIPKQIIMEMAYYLEEKVLFTSEMAYREGEKADAIYMIKNGEIEISATKEHLAIIDNERVPPKPKTKFNEKQRIMVGRLPAGSIFGEEEIIKRMKKRKYSAKTLQPLTFLYVIKKKVFHEIFENFFPDIVHILKGWMDLKYKWREQRIQKEKHIADLRSEENEIAVEKTETQKNKRINKDDSAYKARRTVTEKDADEIHGEDSSLILMNSTLRFNNISPSNGNLTGTGSNLYFTKFKNPSKNILTPDAQSKIILKTIESSHVVQTKEGIEMQKTKLFVDNQTKFNKFRKPHLPQKAHSKRALFTAKRQLEISTKPEIPTTQILNFDKAKDLQKSEKQITQEATQPSSSRKVSTTSLSSPRFFIVRSYGLSNASPSSFDSDLFLRRHSSHLYRDYESSAPSSLKNLEVRRGTVAGDIKESKFEDEKYEHMKNYMEGLIGQKNKHTPAFMIRPATSLQQFERTNKSKYQVSSNGGSLAYLDTRPDEPSLNEPQSAKNASSLLLKDTNFNKKVLSPRIADQAKLSPKVGLTNFQLKVNGKTFDKQIE